MTVGRSFSPTIKHQTYNSYGNIRNSTDYNYRLQTAPALSFQQYARSITNLPNTEPWRPSGNYQPPRLHSYLSRETRPQPQIPAVHPWIYAYRRKYSIPTYTLQNYKDIRPVRESVWHPPGRYIEKQPTSLSPEKIKQRRVHEPVWHPPGKPEYKPIPYFDPPNLRWSLQQLRRSMPDLPTRSIYASRSRSTMTSQYKKDF